MRSQRPYIIVALYSVAAVVLGFVKIPSPVGSIAMDSFPGYFAAGYYGPLLGGLIGAIGHIGSAATAGFPLSWLHAVIAVQMFLWCSAFGLIVRMGNSTASLVLGAAVAMVLNGIVAPFLLVPFGLPMDPWVLIPFLSVAAAVNVVLAAVVLRFFASADLEEL